MKVVVTIPAYNEEKTLGKVLQDINRYMDFFVQMSKAKDGKEYEYEVIVVSDGSTDNTVNIAKSNGAIVYEHQINKGLAKSYNSEMEYCLKHNADIIIHTDADGQYLAEEIPNLIWKVEEGYDLVLGSRFLGTIEYMPWLKRFGNKAFSRVISKICGMKFTDCQTGFRGMSRRFVEDIRVISNYSYTQETVIRAVKGNYKVIEIPAYFARRDGKSRLMKNPFHYAVRASTNLLRIYRDYEPLKFFGSIGAIFIIASLIISGYLGYGYLVGGILKHKTLQLMATMAFLVGIQMIIFAFQADMNKKM